MNREQQLRLLIRQHTEESNHHAREAQRLEAELRRHREALAVRRKAHALTGNDSKGGAA